ncbi:MAG: hypothetical protein JW862_18110 [Anaerolineales bacterium]|nr:hypothetical protein [Anaerolineales bacterium]
MDRNIWIAFVVGLLAGWLIEWLIDYFYWRRKCRAEKDALQVEVHTLLAVRRDFEAKLTSLEKELAAARAELVAGKAQVQPDPLQQIRGIGPVIENKLIAAGVTTFDQLGQLTPEQLETVLGEDIKRLSDEVVLIEQARQLAAARNRPT